MTAARLAIFCRSLEGGGAERVLVTVANGLAGKGHEVSLVLGCGLGPALRDVASRVQVICLGKRTPFGALVPLVRFLDRDKPQAILATLVAENAIALAAARLARHRPRVVVREANTLSVALRYRSRASRVVAGSVARATYPRADAIVAVSNDAKRDLAAFLGVAEDRVSAIPNPAPPMRERSSEKRERPLVVAAGRLVPKKGFDVLLAAFAEAPEAELVILGEGPERERLERRIAELGLSARARLAGFVTDPLSWFARADLFVLSSFAEGMPNVLLQAMACGCPVVATDCPSGPREILDHGRWGRLVPPHDVQALAGAITASLKEKSPRDVRRRASDFDEGAIVTAYERLLLGPP